MSVPHSRSLALALALAATATVGCTTSPIEPERSSKPELSLVGGAIGGAQTVLKNTTGLILGLVSCRPLTPEDGSQWIGPKGGTLKVGEYTLVVPAGALDRQVKITMQQVRDTVNSVRFGPEGLKFARSARLTMYYYNCRQLPGGREHKIAYVDESLRVLESPKSRDDEKRSEVSADIDHFSRYAVAW